MFKMIVIVLIVTVIGLTAFSAVENAMNASSGAGLVSASGGGGSGSTTITVTLSGEVENPGTYYVDLGATLGDVIDKAGGASSNSDSRAYYTSYEVSDGASHYIAPLKDASDACSYEEISKVNINSADKAALMEVPGIGDSIATSIVSYRESNDPFYAIEEIKNVSGIGAGIFSKCKDYIILKDS